MKAVQSITEIARRIRRNLTLVSFFGLLSLAITFTVFSYYQQLRSSERLVLSRLQGIAKTLALQIDGELHQKIIDKYKKKDSISKTNQNRSYKKLHRLLARVEKANNLGTPIYTLVLKKDASKGKLKDATFFGVTSANKPYFRHPYTPPLYTFENYEVGGVMRPYGDKHGMWLSAFAPIRDSLGEVKAIVQTDMRFDRFMNEAREQFYKNLLIAVLIFFCFTVLLLRFIIQITKPLLFHQEKHTRNQDFQEQLMLESMSDKETVSHLSAIIDSHVEAMLVTNKEGTIIHINPAFMELFGAGSAGVVGMNYDELRSKALVDLLHQVRVEHDLMIRQEIELSDGKRVLVSVSGILRSNPNSGKKEWIGLMVVGYQNYVPEPIPQPKPEPTPEPPVTIRRGRASESTADLSPNTRPFARENRYEPYEEEDDGFEPMEMQETMDIEAFQFKQKG